MPFLSERRTQGFDRLRGGRHLGGGRPLAVTYVTSLPKSMGESTPFGNFVAISPVKRGNLPAGSTKQKRATRGCSFLFETVEAGIERAGSRLAES